MVSETIKNLKRRYENSRHKNETIGKDLITPCLKECVKYRRSTGFFQISAFRTYISSLDEILDNNAILEIICSPKIKPSLLEKLDSVADETSRKKFLEENNNNITLAIVGLNINNNENKSHSFKQVSLLMQYLIAKDRLRIKFAYMRNIEDIEIATGFDDGKDFEEIDDKSLYHVKRGYFTFKDKNVLAFEGSVNESFTAHYKNDDHATVSKSWENKYQEDLEDIVSRIDRDWDEKNPDLLVCEISKETLKKIKDIAPSEKPKIKISSTKGQIEKIDADEPKLPNNIKLHEHQKNAIIEWNRTKKGILAHATGSGKTFTSLAAAVRTYQESQKLVLIVVVPYQILADQWVEEMEKFNMFALPAYEKKENWESSLQNKIQELKNKKKYFFPIVSVVKTFSQNRFQYLYKKLEPNNILVIGDECHNYSANKYVKLFSHPRMKLGLSATPFNPNQFQARIKNLFEIFGKVCDVFSLKDALNADLLSPYKYNLVFCSPSDDERDSIIELNSQIKQAFARDPKRLNPKTLEIINKLNKKLEIIYGSIQDKFKKLEELLQTKKPEKFSIFYVAEGDSISNEGNNSEKNIKKINKILHSNHWKVSNITANESSKEIRKLIIDSFKDEQIHALAAMKILDEGLDIPAINNGYIMASSSSYRQFVQRRGRILRKSKNKNLAQIYDFILIPNKEQYEDNYDLWETILNNELFRVNEFANNSTNEVEIKNIIKNKFNELKINYNLEKIDNFDPDDYLDIQLEDMEDES